jgi:hypothetical protein
MKNRVPISPDFSGGKPGYRTCTKQCVVLQLGESGVRPN